MELKGANAGVRVYDSYAHHPVEIVSDLVAARELAVGGRVLVCFQPHLFSRTQAFAEEMGQALGAADQVVVMDVYPARETPVAGVTGALVARAVPLDRSDVFFEPDSGRVAPLLVSLSRPGDLVLTLGAGDVTEIGPQVLDLLTQRDEERA
jgi:UDP-N-acetylmuramate--alanine ligase